MTLNSFSYLALALTAALALPQAVQAQSQPAAVAAAETATHYRRTKIDGIELFYREAGPTDAPVVVLLHGFPTSSNMFRNLIPALSDRYRVIAPDYPGFGQSEMPDRARFQYGFAKFAELTDGLLANLG